ncbi:hypothetical protein EHQ24_17330 [Leptospira noumeaensis]|uniref:Uncharacterized protein n=1 Tax=Leptospira noumeaensis TaxID=2484964 RepID=A0A4R9HZF7_9LEPT|nr:hypothetical protein [Leptospira noumeaensis]TGK78317.1 hypothetical protein EHQ24_17330 [Leptospira noumeaensis]
MPDTEKKDAVIDQIYKEINKLLGTQNQLFCMEFPGRVLNEDTYAYKNDAIYSILTKPQPVIEQEFRLSDDLFDVSQISAGPNGSKLSTTYESVINLLIPKYQENSQFNSDKAKMRKWLLEKIETEVNGKTLQISRIELYEQLLQAYLTEKSDWKLEKEKKLAEANSIVDSEERRAHLEEFSKWFANVAPVRDALIGARFDDLVSRGYYHEVLRMLGYLDQASESESIEATKTKMRNSSMLSLDESTTIFPVQFQPVDWFSGLNTDFTPQDLLMDPDLIKSQIISKEKQLDDLESQLISLQMAKTGDIATLESQVADAQSKYDSAQSDMIKNFGNVTVSLIQMYYSSKSKKSSGGSSPLQKDEFDKEMQSQGSSPLTDEQWKQLVDMQNKTVDAQQSLIQTSRSLADLEAKLAAAHATNTSDAQLTLKNQIQQIIADLNNLKQLYNSQFDSFGSITSATIPVSLPANLFERKDLTAADLAILNGAYTAGQPTTNPYTLNENAVTAEIRGQIASILNSIHYVDKSASKPPLPSSSPKVGKFMDLVMSFTKGTQYKESTLSQGSSHTSWSVSVLFGSAGGSSDTSYSNFSSKYKADNTSFKIGMRLTKVAIDRGGWFNPELLNHTDDMFRLSKKSISNGIPNDPANPTKQEMDAFTNNLFPAFPIGFVIAKDVTIQIEIDSVDQETAQSYLHKSSSIGGGFLCFSASHSESSTTQSQSFYSSVENNNIIIRIPGPQILGWFLEYVNKDNSSDYAPMPDGFLPDDGIKKAGLPTVPTFPFPEIHTDIVSELGDPAPPKNAKTVVLSGHGAISVEPNKSFNFQRLQTAKSTIYYYTFDSINILDSMGQKIERAALDKNQIFTPYVKCFTSLVGGTELRDMLLFDTAGLRIYTPPNWNKSKFTLPDIKGKNCDVLVAYDGVNFASSTKFQVTIGKTDYGVLMSTIVQSSMFANLSCDFLWAACKTEL